MYLIIDSQGRLSPVITTCDLSRNNATQTMRPPLPAGAVLFRGLPGSPPFPYLLYLLMHSPPRPLSSPLLTSSAPPSSRSPSPPHLFCAFRPLLLPRHLHRYLHVACSRSPPELPFQSVQSADQPKQIHACPSHLRAKGGAQGRGQVDVLKRVLRHRGCAGSGPSRRAMRCVLTLTALFPNTGNALQLAGCAKPHIL